MQLEEIHQHWEEAGEALQPNQAVTPTSRDPYLGKLERENVLANLNKKMQVLEVGCGDAVHTINYAKKVKHLTGADVSSSLIKAAENNVRNANINNIALATTSVLDIDTTFPAESFDAIITQRCLINLPTWEYQQEAIIKCAKLLKPAGLLLLTEGFDDGLIEINRLRKQMNLSEIKVVDYNKNMNKKPFEAFIKQNFDIIALHDYGTYLYLSRVLYPASIAPDQPKHDSKFNEVAMQLGKEVEISNGEKYSYNLFYVLRKKS